MIIKTNKYDDLINFCNKDLVLHTFCYDMISHANAQVYLSLEENNIVGYLIFRNQYSLVNLTSLVQESDVIEFCKLIKSNERSLTSNEYTYRRLKCHLGFSSIKYNHIAAMKKLQKKPVYEFSLVQDTDITGINELRKICFTRNTDIIFDKNDQRKSYDYLIKDNNMIVFVTQSTKSGPSIMITGVCTHPDYRQKGYATEGVAYQCNQILKDNKTPVLFYTDEIAAKIYLRLGFEPQDYIYCMFDYTIN